MPISRTYALGLLFFTVSWLAYDHYRPWVNFHSELLAFLGLAGMLGGALFHVRRSVEFPRIALWVAVAAVIPWVQYATGISPFAGDALMVSLFLSGLFTAVFLGFTLSPSAASFKDLSVLGLMHGLWIAAMVSAAIGLAQWLNVQGSVGMYFVQTDIGDRAMGNLGQPNQLATLLLMGMVAFAYVFERNVIGPFSFIGGSAFMTTALIMSQSRAGMLSVVVVTAFLAWKNQTAPLRLGTKPVVVWMVCFLVGTWLLPLLSDALLIGDLRKLTSAEPVTQRFKMWQQVGYAIWQSPWVGYGWNQTPTAHAAGAVAFPSSVTYTNAHNFFVDILAWNGLPFGLTFSGAIVWWFFTRARSVSRVEARYAMACLLPLAVHSMLEYPFAYAYFLIAAGLMIGIVEATGAPNGTFKVNLRFAWGFLTMWLVVGSYLSYEYFLIEEDFRVVRFENLRIGKTPAAYEVPHVWMISQMAAMLKAARQVATPDMPKADLENLRDASSRFAYGALRFRYAQSLALNGDPIAARKQLDIVRGMYGDVYYAACIAEIRRLQKEKYPQFAAVLPP
jgi:O-antigen ligase